MASTPTQQALCIYFEDEANKVARSTSSGHKKGKRRLEALSKYVLTLDPYDARLTPFLLWQDGSTAVFNPGAEVARSISRIGVDNTGDDEPGRLFDALSGVATDDIRKRNEAAK